MPCCKYCNTTQFCGIVRPDWLQENSTYQGQLNISGMLCDGWMKEGVCAVHHSVRKTCKFGML